MRAAKAQARLSRAWAIVARRFNKFQNCMCWLVGEYVEKKKFNLKLYLYFIFLDLDDLLQLYMY